MLRLLLVLELLLESDDDDTKRLGYVQRGGRRPRRADDRRGRDQDVLDLLDRDAGVHRRADVHEVGGIVRTDGCVTHLCSSGHLGPVGRLL